MINGKINYMPVESVVQMLSGMGSDNIEKIELITTPPANFDAEGNAGFINIVLRENQNLGFNGNASVTAGYGNGEMGNANLNFNYRKNKLNFFGSYSYTLDAQYQEVLNRRETNFQGDQSFSRAFTERYPHERVHTVRTGVDFKLGSKTTLGLLAAGYDNKWTMEADNVASTITNGMFVDSLTLKNNERNQWKHIMGNVNLEHKLNDGEKLTLNLDRLYYIDENPNTYDINYFDVNGNLFDSEETRSDKTTPIDIYVAQLDYEKSHSDFLSMQAGLKAALSEFNNDVSVEIFENNQWNTIERFTNVSDLSELRLMAYVSFDYKLDQNNSFKIGLRYEHTDSELNTVKEGTVVDREFGNLFPTVYYSKTINDNQSVALSYNKRITRPTFNDMAPFAIFIDPSLYFFGNAGLQPSISDNIKLDYRLSSVYLSLQYSKEDSTIARFQDFVDPETNEQSFRPTNLSSVDQFSASLSFPIRVTRHWEMQNNIIATYTDIQSYYEEELVTIDNFNYNINSTQSFLLGGGYSMELNGFYRSDNLWGRSTLEAFYGITYGFQKKFDNGSVLRFNVRDVFNSIEWAGGTDLPDQGFSTYGIWDFSNTTFSIGYSMSFGNSEAKAFRKRTTGSEEEQNRVN